MWKIFKLLIPILSKGKNNHPTELFPHSGVVTRNNLSYSYKLLVTFSISIRTTHLWTSSYSDYQQFLFDKIKGLKDDFLTPICYRKISKLLNGEGLKTPRGNMFKNNHVHSIYKKGLIRKERMNRKDIVEVSQPIIEELK